MKLFRNLFLILFFCNTAYSFLCAEEQLITNVYIHDNDTNYRYSYIYNQGQMRVELKYFRLATNWVLFSQTEWIFENNLCVKHIEQEYKNHKWENTYLIEYTYKNERIISEKHFVYVSEVATPVRLIDYAYSPLSLLHRKTIYSYSGSQEIMVEQNDYTYTDSNNLQSATQTLFDTDMTAAHQYIFTYTYNSRNQTDSVLLQERVLSEDIENKKLTTCQYVSGSNLIRFQRNQQWDSERKEWINTQKLHYEYADNRLIRETYQKWDAQFWRDELRYDYIYDSYGSITAKTTSKSIYQQWRNVMSITYSDFQQTQPCYMEAKYDFWGGNMGEYVSTYIPFTFNNEIVIKKAKTIEISYQPDKLTSNDSILTFNVYPNPSDGIFYFDIQKYDISSWSVYDTNGRMLKNQTQPQMSGIINLTDLRSGVYILKANAGKGEIYRKLIKR